MVTAEAGSFLSRRLKTNCPPMVDSSARPRKAARFLLCSPQRDFPGVWYTRQGDGAGEIAQDGVGDGGDLLPDGLADEEVAGDDPRRQKGQHVPQQAHAAHLKVADPMMTLPTKAMAQQRWRWV